MACKEPHPELANVVCDSDFASDTKEHGPYHSATYPALNSAGGVWAEAVSWPVRKNEPRVTPSLPLTARDGRLYDAPLEWENHWDIAMDRDLGRWVEPKNGECAQFGCGLKFIDGWDNWDYPEWDPERPGYRLPYADGTLGAIACYHTLDHLTPDGVVNALAEWQRVLMPGAAATVVVPHYMSQLANECIMHKSRFAIDTWRNIFSERQYQHFDGVEWKWTIGFNMILGITERNLVQMTQLIRRSA